MKEAQSRTIRAGWHFGTASRRRRIGRFHLLVSHFPPNLLTPRHAHESSAFSLVLDGRYTQRFGRREVEYRPAGVVFRPRALEHDDRVSDRGASCFIIEPDRRWLTDIGLAALDERGVIDGTSSPCRWLAHRVMTELRTGDASSALAIEGLVLALAAHFARVRPVLRGSAPAWLERTREALEADCSSHLTLTTLAADAGVHPVYLSAAFKKAFGMSIGAYVRRLRIDAAREALRNSNRAISDIALSLGFASQSHFTRVFREHTGLTPLAYRRLATP